MTQVQLKVSTAGVLRTLADQFTDKQIWVRELLQNARRAGASQVELIYDAETNVMVVEDDGTGLRDFEALFTVGVSAWNMEIMERENPFGVGALSMLFASQWVDIETDGGCCRFDTKDVLDQKPVKIQSSPDRKGTRLTLGLHDEHRATNWRNYCSSQVQGFPIPVLFNGDDLPRPFAEKALPFSDTPVGKIHLGGWDKSSRGSIGSLFFLQGLPVCASQCKAVGAHPDVVHLDPQLFRARVPDRTELVDAPAQHHTYNHAQKTLWLQRLKQCRQSLTTEHFVESWWDKARALRAWDLINDLPIPGDFVGQFVGPVAAWRDWERDQWAENGHNQVAPSKDLVVVPEPELSVSTAEEPFGLLSLYAMKKGWQNLSEDLPETHWLSSQCLDLWDGRFQALVAEVKGAQESVSFTGRRCRADIVLCSSYHVRLVDSQNPDAFQDVEVTDCPVFDASNQRVLVPKDAADDMGVLRQICEYESEFDDLLELDYEEDVMMFWQLVEAHRLNDAAGYLEQALNETTLASNFIEGKTFRVSFNGRWHCVEVNEG